MMHGITVLCAFLMALMPAYDSKAPPTLLARKTCEPWQVAYVEAFKYIQLDGAEAWICLGRNMTDTWNCASWWEWRSWPTSCASWTGALHASTVPKSVYPLGQITLVGTCKSLMPCFGRVLLNQQACQSGACGSRGNCVCSCANATGADEVELSFDAADCGSGCGTEACQQRWPVDPVQVSQDYRSRDISFWVTGAWTALAGAAPGVQCFVHHGVVGWFGGPWSRITTTPCAYAGEAPDRASEVWTCVLSPSWTEACHENDHKAVACRKNPACSYCAMNKTCGYAGTIAGRTYCPDLRCPFSGAVRLADTDKHCVCSSGYAGNATLSNCSACVGSTKPAPGDGPCSRTDFMKP
eukprot:m51a1_g11466 hypothetical protein (353) ;mRNA; r:54-5729